MAPSGAFASIQHKERPLCRTSAFLHIPWDFGELLAIAPKSGRSKDWAEAFLLNTKSSATDGDDVLDDESAEDPAPGG